MFLTSANMADHRRKWDVDEYERMAAARLKEEEDALTKRAEKPAKRELLQPRDYKVSDDGQSVQWIAVLLTCF